MLIWLIKALIVGIRQEDFRNDGLGPIGWLNLALLYSLLKLNAISIKYKRLLEFQTYCALR